MKTIVCIYLLFGLTKFSYSATVETFTQQADALLIREVNNGQVDYRHIKQNFEIIDALYQQIGKIDLAESTATTKKAFYLNAYNIIVIHEVAKYYPLKSPMDKSGFFDKVRHRVAGEELSLNALEIKKIILPYKDPRIHFALACAAKSCPLLASNAFQPEKLDRQLEERTRLSLNNEEFIRVSEKEKVVRVSKIFDWYKSDFTQQGMHVIDFINQHRTSAIDNRYQLDFYEYNWTLNAQ